jgi:uncharacterized protein YggU (UPF0235/DUF167 family)
MPEIYVKVRPETEFEIEMKTYPVIGLENEPEHGKANSELLNRLEDITGVRPAIVLGHKSRRKKLKIDMDKQEFKERLENFDG